MIANPYKIFVIHLKKFQLLTRLKVFMLRMNHYFTQLVAFWVELQFFLKAVLWQIG